MSPRSDRGSRATLRYAAPRLGSCEKISSLTQRRQGAKTRKEQLFCFLCAFYDFAPLREMLLLMQGLFHSFLRRGPHYCATNVAQTLPSALTLALMGRCYRPPTSTPCGVGCRSRGVLRRLGSGAPHRRDHARAAATSDLQVAAFRTQIVLCAVHFSWPERHRWYFAL